MQNQSDSITLFFLAITFIVVLMVLFILFIIVLHRKKELKYQNILKERELAYEKSLLNAKLEIQEQTFVYISREIHDNIGLSLTLAKLQLNTLDFKDIQKIKEKTLSSIELLSKSICELSDISKGLNAQLIIQNGLLKAIENEISRIREADLFEINFDITGAPVYFDQSKDLIIFRIIQEAFNNIIKHAHAESVHLHLTYNESSLIISIRDNGKGFDIENNFDNRQAGLKNMENRATILDGNMTIESIIGTGTNLTFTIPLDKHGKKSNDKNSAGR